MTERRLLRPMTYGEIVNEAFDLYKRNFLLFTGIGAIVYVPYALLSALTAGQPALRALVTLGLYLPLFAVNGAIIKAIADRYLGREVTISSAWRHILRRLVPYLATSMRAGVMLFIGFILFVVPAIIVGFWVFFLTSVMMVEDRFYRAALQRSRELAAGMWGRLFAVGILAIVIAVGALAILGTIDGILMVALGSAAGAEARGGGSLALNVASELLSAALQVFITPITSLLSVLLYFDVRVRKEGFDIEMLAQEMSAVPAG